MEEVEPSTRVVREVSIITTLVVTRLTSPRVNSKKLISKRERARSTIQKKESDGIKV